MPRLIGWVAAALVLGLIGSGIWLRSGSRPSVEVAAGLMAEGRWDEADRILSDQLRQYPDDPTALQLVAESALDRPDPQPERALEALRRLHPALAEHQALVALKVGVANYYLTDYVRAESAWKDAIRLDPQVPEAGWGLLDLYYVQGRRRDAMALALSLHETEPDPDDRVKLLFELVRGDLEPPDPASLIGRIEPVVRSHPEDHATRRALGLALVKLERVEEGLGHLAAVAQAQPGVVEHWDAWLTALAESGRFDDLRAALAQAPAPLADSPEFALARGRLAERDRLWSDAARAYEVAWRHRPDDVERTYRVALANRRAGDAAAAEAWESILRQQRAARAALEELLDDATTQPGANSTIRIAPPLYRRFAELLEQLERRREAEAWYRLASAYDPDDLLSRDALRRLSMANPRSQPPDAAKP